MKRTLFKSSKIKRSELYDAIFETEFVGAAMDWLTERGHDIYELTDDDIDRIINEKKRRKEIR